MIRSSSFAALAGTACLALGSFAHAGVAQAGSLLVFPCFDTSRGAETIITVTNQNDNPTSGTVKVEYVYINGYSCQETNRTRTLTPNDTLTVLATWDNPNVQRGYVYVFAKDVVTGRAIKFDNLIGASRVIGCSDNNDYEVAPFVFLAGAGLAAGAQTDLDNDGIRDLNGNEYEQAPAQILIPRFIGQECGHTMGKDLNDSNLSSLVLINLSGGAQFTAIIDFLIYNDNEEVFSAQYDFQCWKKVPLLHISGVFHNNFLLTTNHNVAESVDGGETGWMRINGLVASSTAAQIADPAVLAVLIEKIDGATCAELPYAIGVQPNGDLLPRGIFGDLTP